MELDQQNTRSLVTIQAPASITATGNSTGVQLPVGVQDSLAQVCLAGLNTAGSTPTLAVAVQTSPDNSNWTTVANFTGLTTTNVNGVQSVGVDLRDTAYIRFAYTIGGTSSPAYTIAGFVSVRKQNVGTP